MRLKDALDAYTDKAERDSVENIAVTKTTTTNFSLSNVRVGIQTKHHPMPYDPANFSFSYSHSHVHKQGETTVYENEDTWRGSLNYQWSPVYKAYEPFKKIKSKSKYYDILRRFGLNWLPQSVAFNTEMTRNYYELQERDMEQLEGSSPLPLTFSSQFLWNRDFNLRWDLTPNLQFSFQSATHAEIEEPYTAVNKDLYPERYEAWKDSVWTSIKHLGTPLDYSQNVSASYRLPLNLIPIFDWLTADGSYSSTYNPLIDLYDGNYTNETKKYTMMGNLRNQCSKLFKTFSCYRRNRCNCSHDVVSIKSARKLSLHRNAFVLTRLNRIKIHRIRSIASVSF